MKISICALVLGAFLIACSNSISYQEGQEMADRTYGSMAPDQMIKQVDSIMQQVQLELENADDKREWWDGFCDRGEEIWLARIEQINSMMGQSVLDSSEVRSVFNHMRSSFRE